MTNRERLNQMNNQDYWLETQMFTNCTVRKYVDYEAWLTSEDEEYPIIGQKAAFKETNGMLVDCWKVDETQIGGADYAVIVIKEPGLHVFKTIKVPAANVTVV